MEASFTSSAPLNPYVVGGALDPSGKAFYGREDIFEFVRSGLNVAQRNPILLYGQRRVGKSSILRQLPRRLSPLRTQRRPTQSHPALRPAACRQIVHPAAIAATLAARTRLRLLRFARQGR